MSQTGISQKNIYISEKIYEKMPTLISNLGSKLKLKQETVSPPTHRYKYKGMMDWLSSCPTLHLSDGPLRAPPLLASDWPRLGGGRESAADFFDSSLLQLPLSTPTAPIASLSPCAHVDGLWPCLVTSPLGWVPASCSASPQVPHHFLSFTYPYPFFLKQSVH